MSSTGSLYSSYGASTSASPNTSFFQKNKKMIMTAAAVVIIGVVVFLILFFTVMKDDDSKTCTVTASQKATLTNSSITQAEFTTTIQNIISANSLTGPCANCLAQATLGIGGYDALKLKQCFGFTPTIPGGVIPQPNVINDLYVTAWDGQNEVKRFSAISTESHVMNFKMNDGNGNLVDLEFNFDTDSVGSGGGTKFFAPVGVSTTPFSVTGGEPKYIFTFGLQVGSGTIRKEVVYDNNVLKLLTLTTTTDGYESTVTNPALKTFYCILDSQDETTATFNARTDFLYMNPTYAPDTSNGALMIVNANGTLSNV